MAYRKTGNKKIVKNYHLNLHLQSKHVSTNTKRLKPILMLELESLKDISEITPPPIVTAPLNERMNWLRTLLN